VELFKSLALVSSFVQVNNEVSVGSLIVSVIQRGPDKKARTARPTLLFSYSSEVWKGSYRRGCCYRCVFTVRRVQGPAIEVPVPAVEFPDPPEEPAVVVDPDGVEGLTAALTSAFHEGACRPKSVAA
jgi:hypothetical protein